MFICINKKETIHHFYCYFVEKLTDFPVNSVKFAIALCATCISRLNVSHGSRD